MRWRRGGGEERRETRREGERHKKRGEMVNGSL